MVCLHAATGYSQEAAQDTTEEKKSYWSYSNIGNLYLAQIAYSDYWKGSGYNNINVWGDFDWKAKYKKEKSNFTYNFNVQYGLMKRDEQEWTKNRDKLEMSGNYSQQFSNKMFLSALISMRTFLSNSYKFNKQGMKQHLNGRFFSPLTIDIGSGLNLKTLESNDPEKKKKNTNKLDIYYTPINSKITIAPDSILAAQYLPEKFRAKGYRMELGSLIKVVGKFQLMKNVTLTSKADFFTNHLDDFGNFDVNLESQIRMKVNKSISVNILGNLVYDEDILFDILDEDGEPTGHKGPRTQFSESINVGITHSF
ncbi:DUF3078 domain-containing protein [Membranicola marinus]|uniref:DUF3078 domain-containing protein n=1 Tax=Membranihabitans marinus TaxID=1227546 RepID=A0A953HMN6_9BACT|nr:DUF3078 domain-containing protein [Membranihabitans marinus]MBY5958794.1 DUF3078 domain-containing protein [Membranihabitans marinus]